MPLTSDIRPNRALGAALALLAGAVLALGACGDDEETSTTATASGDDVVSTTLDPDQAPTTPPDLPKNDDPSAVQCTGPPEGVFDATAIIGESVEGAMAAAEAEGCSIRVVVEDGEPLAVTQDFRPDRVNVVVEDGDVAEIDSLG